MLVLQLYFGPIYPKLIYCITVWGASNKNVTSPLQILQYKLVRAICGRPLINSLKIFSVTKVYKYLVYIYIFKSISRSENLLYAMELITTLDKP